jgi:antitoxin (DNA-binding transcriptional repressor) of toxin-antitoxin stability system
MKTIGVRELQKRIRECVEASQAEIVVITRNGKPASIVIGVEGSDWEDLVIQSNPAFWSTIRERRKEKSIPADEMRSRVLAPAKRKTPKGRRTTP